MSSKTEAGPEIYVYNKLQRKVDRARQGHWGAARSALDLACQHLRQDYSQLSAPLKYLASALLSSDGHPQHEALRAAGLTLQSVAKLSAAQKQVVLAFVDEILDRMKVATEKTSLGLDDDVDPGMIFVDRLPAYQYLDLPRDLAVTLGLNPGYGKGRPKSKVPADLLKKECDLLRGYGVSWKLLYSILAHRLDKSDDTIRRILKRAGISETVASRPPGEPYFKAKLAVAVELLAGGEQHTRDHLDQVAKDFGLEASSHDKVEAESLKRRTRNVVQSALETCKKNEQGWAYIPLAVARAEGTRVIPSGLGMMRIASQIEDAYRTGNSTKMDLCVERDIFARRPDWEAVQVVARKEDIPCDIAFEACDRREKLDLANPPEDLRQELSQMRAEEIEESRCGRETEDSPPDIDR